VLVIGIGNPLREDDGVGPAAARRLAALFPADLCGVLTPLQLLPELADPVSRAELVAFIDASRGGPAGQIECHELTATDIGVPGDWPRRPLSHHLDPATLLALTAGLFGRSPRAFLFSMRTNSFGFSTRLTRASADALDELVARAAAAIRSSTEAVAGGC
jgi:hydrogenase maturation protease